MEHKLIVRVCVYDAFAMRSYERNKFLTTEHPFSVAHVAWNAEIESQHRDNTN